MPRIANDLDKAVGRRMASARREAGLSQHALGAAIRTSYQQVQKYENGTNRISAGTLQQVAHHLNLPITTFFDTDQDDLTWEERALLSEFKKITTPSAKRQVVKVIQAIAESATANGT